MYVCLYVCLYVCMSHNQIIKSEFQRKFTSVSRKHLSMFRVNLYLIILFFDNERENFVLLSRSVYAATLTCLLGN